MKFQQFKTALVGSALAGVLAVASTSAMAQDAKSLDQLLDFVKRGQATEAKENRAREARFRQAKNRQAQELAGAKRTRVQEEQRSARLEATFEANDLKVNEKQRQLKERMGSLGELFGHLTSAAGDLRSNLTNSLTSSQFPGRDQFLDALIEKMNSAEQLPSIEEIERLWYEMQREMTESGKVVSFSAEVASPTGEKATQTVVRVGTFNAINTDGKYLRYIPETNTLAELARQPSGSYQSWASDLAGSSGGITAFGADPTGPSGGSFLAAIINSPNLEERWHQGGNVGYVITAVGIFALILAIWRIIVLTIVSSKVKAQVKSDTANTNNPLGRVLKVHEENPSMDTETLELKLSEAVLKEVPKIEFGLNLLKIIAAVAPLMGLLGTVTGMIITFQAITIFGAGDPKAMAGGISGALITTVLGLLVAIPTVLLHTVTNGQAKKIIHILDEQTTGIIAEHTEAQLGK